MTEQNLVGGVPTTNLTIPDIITYYGAIVGSSSSGDLIAWQQDSNKLDAFTLNLNGTYDYDGHTDEDCQGRDLEYVMELAVELFG